MQASQSSTAPWWTYVRSDAGVLYCAGDGDVEHGQVGVLCLLSRRVKVGNLHQQLYSFQTLVELEHLNELLPEHKQNENVRLKETMSSNLIFGSGCFVYLGTRVPLS